MKIIGIVVEYNPFHTGHKNHIDKIKKIYPESIIIAAMSGNVVQRGEFSIYDKWSRTQTALENGVDIVVQIPSFDVLNSAETFCRSSIEVLNYFKVDEVIFGSESNDIDNLNKLSNKLLEPSAKSEIESINKRLNSYPKAVEEYLGGELKPNDILGITYISEAKKINDKLLVKSIQRDRGERFKSASEIRKELRNNESSEFDLVKSNPRSMDWIIKIIKAKFINESDDPFVKYIQNVLKNNEIKTWDQ